MDRAPDEARPGVRADDGRELGDEDFDGGEHLFEPRGDIGPKYPH